MASTTDFNPQGFRDWMNLVFIFCWALILLWILWWLVTCGECCGFLNKCLLKPEDRFRSFRVLVICNTVIMFLTWVINFNPSLQFNPKYPVLYATNIVSWIDLIVSFIEDVYLKCADIGACARADSVGEDNPADVEDANDK